MELKETITKDQEVLITTIHNQESVVEVYLNGKSDRITELRHLSNDRIMVYQYPVKNYLMQMKGFKGIDLRIMELLQN